MLAGNPAAGDRRASADPLLLAAAWRGQGHLAPPARPAQMDQGPEALFTVARHNPAGACQAAATVTPSPTDWLTTYDIPKEIGDRFVCR